MRLSVSYSAVLAAMRRALRYPATISDASASRVSAPLTILNILSKAFRAFSVLRCLAPESSDSGQVFSLRSDESRSSASVEKNTLSFPSIL